MDKEEKQRTLLQNRALHKGFQEIADCLVENGISLQKAFKDLEIRPTKESIKSIFRQVANAKFEITSTTELTTKQIDEVWEDVTKALSENTGVFFPFPCQENTDNYLNSYNQYEK